MKALKLFTVLIMIRRQELSDLSLQCFMMKLYFKIHNFKASSAPAQKTHAARGSVTLTNAHLPSVLVKVLQRNRAGRVNT